MLLVTGMSGLLVLVLTRSNEIDSEVQQPVANADAQPDRERSTPSKPVYHEAVTGSPSLSGGEPDLRSACPDPVIEVLSDECLQALDQFFLSKAFGKLVR